MFLLIDIGGTNTRLAISRNGKTIERFVVKNTPPDAAAGMRLIKQLAGNFSKEGKIRAVCCGIAGPLNKGKNTFLQSPHLPKWIGFPLKQKLSRAFSAPVYMENDTALAGLGEAIYGAGKGYAIVAYITVSTGIGGVRIVHKHIDNNAQGFEIGHQVIQLYGRKAKTLEAIAGGAALERTHKRKPESIKDKKIWKNEARFIAYGLNNTIVYWSPDILVLGGGLIQSSAISISAIKGHLKDILHIFPTTPPVVRSVLKDASGLYGALAYIHQHYLH